MKRWYAIAVIATATVGVAIAADLIDARSLLRSVEQASSAEKKNESQPALLLASINSYRSRSGTLPPDAAVREWFALLDRAQQLGSVEWNGNYESFDTVARSMVSVRSLLASLPPPAAWPALRKEAEARAIKSPQSVEILAQRMLAEALNNDAAAVQSTLAQLETVAAKADPSERSHTLQLILAARNAVADIFGSPDYIVASFVASLELAAKEGSAAAIDVPDLVGLVGTERASALLQKAISSPARLNVSRGDETRILARSVALQGAASMRVPQWGLADSIDSDVLYETLQQRFGNKRADDDSAGFDGASAGFDSDRGEADTYYLLAKIVAGQQAKAENALLALAGNETLHVPKEAVTALQKANQNQALVTFLHAMLGKHPELLAWSLYIEQAAYVGRGGEALALIQQLLGRRDLSPHLRGQLQRRRADALLAANRLDEGIEQLRQQIAAKPKAGDKALLQSTQTAIRLATIGQLLNRPELTAAGMAYAEAATALDSEAFEYQRPDLLHGMTAVYRRGGKPALAQALAVRELNRDDESNDMSAQFGVPAPSPAKRAALVELAGIYGAEMRHADVLTLLDDSRQWGARDLAEFIADRDSLKTPVGVVAARALSATGQRDAAMKVTRQLLERLPGYDPAYELFTQLMGDRAVAELDVLYGRDEFEERPLIWKARVLAAGGKLDEAERVIRQAIAIDPSDGEQGKNDRLRAYAVLADVLEAKREAPNAAVYRKAIEAIRLSENADDFYEVGLYERAFATYQQALALFSDAYCIQSRLAIQLARQGRHAEALVHYRRAYELMPESFGRVESHCFGCESVFKDAEAQGIAEAVFLQAIEHDKQKPQAHYLLGYLREEQGRLPQAAQLYRNTVALDDKYLNAWKHLYELGERTHLDAAERDIARFKLLRLDPRQRHVRYDLTRVRNMAQLWNDVERVAQTPQPEAGAYRLKTSADMYDAALAKLPPEIRLQMTMHLAFMESASHTSPIANPQAALAKHAIVSHAAGLMGAAEELW